MGFEKTESAIPNRSEAIARIAVIEQQAQVMGANDYEPGAFQRIRTQLEAGEMTPVEAVAEAQAILDNKQDYH